MFDEILFSSITNVIWADSFRIEGKFFFGLDSRNLQRNLSEEFLYAHFLAGKSNQLIWREVMKVKIGKRKILYYVLCIKCFIVWLVKVEPNLI